MTRSCASGTYRKFCLSTFLKKQVKLWDFLKKKEKKTCHFQYKTKSIQLVSSESQLTVSANYKSPIVSINKERQKFDLRAATKDSVNSGKTPQRANQNQGYSERD